MCTWVKLRDRCDTKDSMRALLWLNTHWDHRGEVARVESAKLVRREIARLTRSAEIPVIVTGDLNCEEESDAYATLRGRRADNLELIDSYRALHPDRRADEATFHEFKGTTAGSRIDFIFHTAAFQTMDASIDHTRSPEGTFPSDHFPVTAVLRRRD
jgi:endonuclease/exonuclease/phosphatase family metal-dependent hydrolase